MKYPTFLYKDGKSILIDASEVEGKMAEGWRDSPHAPTIEHEPDPEPTPMPPPPPPPAPAPAQPQEAPDRPSDPNMNQASTNP